MSRSQAQRRDPFENIPDEEVFEEVIVRLNRDLREASENLSEREAGYLVSAYYNIQEFRIRFAHQIRRLEETEKPSLVITWLERQSRVLEGQIRAALDRFSGAHRFGPWPRSIVGIGPIISAGLIAHLHLDHCPTAGHFWSFAGLNPDREWIARQKADALISEIIKRRNEKPSAISHETIVEVAETIHTRPEYLIKALTDFESGEVTMTKAALAKAVARRPWNADLKVLQWKIGQSFMKVQAHPDDVYGRVYRAAKDKYIARNESGQLAENAKRALSERNYGTGTIAYQHYSKGILPPAHIDAMARRAAAKLFLAHFWEMCWRIDHPGQTPVAPYPIQHLGHAHVVMPPNWEQFVKAPKKS